MLILSTFHDDQDGPRTDGDSGMISESMAAWLQSDMDFGVPMSARLHQVGLKWQLTAAPELSQRRHGCRHWPIR